MRVLLLEDDAELRRSFARRLRADGHTVDEVARLDAARAALAERRFDCLVLDRSVPDGDALDLVAALAAAGEHPPVIFVSASGEADQRVEGLAAGADDYLAKPVRLDELSLRVRRVATVQSTTAGEDEGVLQLGRVTVDRPRHLVTLDGVAVVLPPIQYAVLEYLAVHRDRTVRSQDLNDACWDRDSLGLSDPLPKVVSSLRRKLRSALRFEKVRGIGYRLVVEAPPGRRRNVPGTDGVARAGEARGRTTP